MPSLKEERTALCHQRCRISLYLLDIQLILLNCCQDIGGWFLRRGHMDEHCLTHNGKYLKAVVSISTIAGLLIFSSKNALGL